MLVASVLACARVIARIKLKRLIYIKASYELQLNILYHVVRKIFSSSVCFTRDYIFYSLDGDVYFDSKT